jgi:alpha-beta hydrolase superfamily lysophospholipase
MADARLTRHEPAGDARAVVLVLHGGRDRSVAPVTATNLSYLRMIPVARDLSRAYRRDGVAVWLLRYRVRGWNASSNAAPDPVGDARWALDEIRSENPDAAIVLVGHSMGGRVACAVADEPGVVGVCCLAPWLPPGEPIEPVKGRDLYVIHGTGDRWTSPTASRAYVERLRDHGSPAHWESIPGAGHFMLKQVPTWRRLTRAAVSALLA